MQAAKIIDVTRSFIPVDPNRYPENLHGTGDEDQPETRVPVIPYMGYNFLPTSNGYKSFFGTNKALGIDALAPNKADDIFIFQTLDYKNVLIALCDTGIWAKAANVGGAWTQLIAQVAPADAVFYEWYTTVIKNRLYVYRANDAQFYKIDTNIAAPLGIDCTAIVPNFITPTAQLGMFRLGARIGFWDATNAVAWCNPDDFSDFTPNVITGANVTTFNSVLGKISAIRAHGNNAIVYASKSITGLSVQPAETFFVKAISILDKAGVPYARQSVASLPDDTHFAYTSAGIYKIDNGKAEVIVPEVYDYFKNYTAQPIYLQLLQGRFLCFQILDANLINGNPIFSFESIPSGTLTFPGYTSLVTNYNAPDGNVCEIANLLGSGLTDEQKVQAAADIPEPQKKGTFAQPIYTAYLSNNGIKDLGNVTWGSVPCGFVGPNGTPFTMSPTNVPKLGDYSTDSTHKTAHYGPDAWVDGIWDIRRFVQAQSAIWRAEEKVLAALLSKIKGRAFFEKKVDANVSACVVAPESYSYCTIGEFASQFSDYQFGFNGCSFWLTRYVLETEVMRAKKTDKVDCAGFTQVTWTSNVQPGVANTLAERVAIDEAQFIAYWSTPDQIGGQYGGGSISGYDVTATAVIDGVLQPTQIVYRAAPTHPPGPDAPSYANANATQTPLFNKTTTGSAINEVQATNTGVLGVESAYCTLTHWKYTDVNGVTKIVPASSCTVPSDYYPGSTSPSGVVNYTDPRNNMLSPDGSFCGEPFKLPDILNLGVNWEDQTVVYPATGFLLQDGGIAPKYPTIYGFFCYDLHLKKWGKAKFDYKRLLDYSPINSESSSPVTFANFGILAGALKEDGLIYVFDDSPTDSQITWGKIGYYRQGITDIQEVRFDFASNCSGNVTVDVSLDGQSVVNSLTFTAAHANSKQVVVYPPYSGKWFNITVSGKYEIVYAEVKMLKKGRR
jgi:hypothetical protein